jgi:Ser-tRNA(Ala) deacylase AlaX
MMHGKFNPDLFCKLIERILSERDENIEVKVKLITEEEAEELKKAEENKNSKMKPPRR